MAEESGINISTNEMRELLSGEEGVDVFCAVFGELKGGARYSLADIMNEKGSIPRDWGLLRSNFWVQMRECERSRTGQYMYLPAVYSGVCSRWYFLDLMSDKIFCRYLLIPVVEHSIVQGDLLDRYGSDVYEQVICMDTSAIENEGLRYKYMKLKMDTIHKLEDRAQGQSVKRVDNKIDQTVKSQSISYQFGNGKKLEADVGNIKKEIEKLEAELQKRNTAIVSEVVDKPMIGYNEKKPGR
jgi:hypothetical protein